VTDEQTNNQTLPSLTRNQQYAAGLLAEGVSRVKVSQKVGVRYKTICNWLKSSLFRQELKRKQEEIAREVDEYLIGDRKFRLLILQDRHDRMQRVFEERAEWFEKANREKARLTAEAIARDEDPSAVYVKHADIPGGETGLLVHEEKVTKFGLVDHYKVDVALLKEGRDTLKQAAIEKGQWVEKSDMTSGDKPLLPPSLTLLIDKVYGDSDQGGNEADRNS
jgi:hypothetical protein